MGRRWGGLALLVAALLLAVAVPNLGAGRLLGTAIAEPIPGPPQLGDCVLENVPAFKDFSVAEVAEEYPSPVTKPCTGSRYGDVFSIVPVTKKIELTTDGSYTDLIPRLARNLFTPISDCRNSTRTTPICGHRRSACRS